MARYAEAYDAAKDARDKTSWGFGLSPEEKKAAVDEVLGRYPDVDGNAIRSALGV
jgi:hypothetical protein